MMAIFKKELLRVFTDRRLVSSILIMPFISILIVYSVLGGLLNTTVDESEIDCLLVNVPAEFQNQYLPNEWRYLDNKIYENSQFSVEDGTIDVIIEFSDNGHIALTYNQENSLSSFAYSKVVSLISDYRDFYLKENNPNLHDLTITNVTIFGDEASQRRMIISGTITTLIVSFIFSGVLAIGCDSIAGEKERLTLQKMLITPVRRSSIALGKTGGIMVIAAISSLSSFLGFFLSSLITGYGEGIILKGFDFLLLALALISFVMITSALICLISTVSRSVKEANSFASPLYLFTSVIALISIVINLGKYLAVYFLPIVGNVTLIQTALAGKGKILPTLIVFSISLVVFLFVEFIIAKDLDREKIYTNN